jgi:hypothetical protein
MQAQPRPRTNGRVDAGDEGDVGADERRRMPVLVGKDRRAAGYVVDAKARQRDRGARARLGILALCAVRLNAANARRFLARKNPDKRIAIDTA